MGRYRHVAYRRSRYPRFIVVWSIHWQAVEVEKIAPMADLAAAIEAATLRLRADGWVTEDAVRFGFAFLSRNGERRLLAITERDPASAALQSFNPFRVKSTP